MKRAAVFVLALGLFSSGGARPVAAQSPEPRDPKLWQRAVRINHQAIVVDTHSDTTTRILDENFDMGARAKDGHMDIPRMKEGGLGAEFFSVYVDKKYVAEGGSARRALDMIDVVYDQVARHPESLEMAYTADDVRRIHAKGKIAALMGIEGGHAIENSLFALRDFYRLGIRYMTLTHTNTNDWADSSGSYGNPESAVPRWHGLNDFGREVVLEMNRLGMLVDVSHVSDETFYDVIETTKAPVIASHSSCRALANHPRNMTDDMLRALAKNGGVIMINFYEDFLDQKRLDAYEKFKAERDAIKAKYKDDEAARDKALEAFDAANVPRTPLSVLIDHIDHAVKVAGVDHVGLGSDFDGGVTLPLGLTGVNDLPAITYELLKRGYSETDVKKILGENLLRAMSEAEGVARDLQKTTPHPRRVPQPAK